MDADAGGSNERPLPLRLAEEVTAAADRLRAASLLSLSVRDKARLMEQVARAERALQAAHLDVVRSLTSEDLATVGATSVHQLIAARLRAPLGRARADVAAARATDPDVGPLPGMGRSLAAGEVSMAHVDVATAVLDKVPARLRRGAATVIDELVVSLSRTHRPREVANLAREVLDRLDPERHERGHDPEAFTRRTFSLVADAYGMGLPSGQLDPMTHALLKTALDHFSAPTAQQASPEGAVLFRDERTPGQRRCDALAEIARRALATAGTGSEGGTRNGEPPRVVVHTTPEQVAGRDPKGSVECQATGPLPAAFLRRVVCDCVLERVLLAPNGAVLDLGRTVRTATPAQRRALAARDHGCVWPGCPTPARWTEVHHVPGWVHGSRTDVAAMALLCGGHHGQVEAGHYSVVMVDGVPHVTPPLWVDPDQVPVRNTYWQDQRVVRDVGRQLAVELGVSPRAASPPDTG